MAIFSRLSGFFRWVDILSIPSSLAKLSLGFCFRFRLEKHRI